MSSFAASLSGEIFAGGYGPLPDRGSWNHDAGTEPSARPVLEASRCRGATQLVSIRKATPPARAVCSFGLAARRFEFTVVFGEPAQARFWRVPGRGKGGLKRNYTQRAWLVSVGFSYNVGNCAILPIPCTCCFPKMGASLFRPWFDGVRIHMIP